ncbi:MAG: hypothetical protein CBD56_01365 [Candidatus Pelagibacter sp. TMED196]|nr:MAG: hypothetical protein CBD56_01365 [Candidatus Pelagibacter sp. TMED196]|tara:strand:+ start:3153 stop:4496 length:1344 start_codon:yes stop_codon:yes gene_type:complete
MNKIFKFGLFFSIFTLLFGCSFQNSGGFFDNKLEEFEKEIQRKNSKIVFAPQKKFNKEVSGVALKNLDKPFQAKKWTENGLNPNNNIPNLLYKNNKNIFFKSKKIGKNKFNLSDTFSEPLIHEDKIFISDFSGNIYNYSLAEKKIIWKFNFYKKRYKNFPIETKLKLSKNNLVISDNLGYLYCLNIKTAEIKWAKNYGIAFNSNLKIYNGKIFSLNQDNKLYIANEDDGNQILGLETFPTFLKTTYKTNISLNGNNIFFITSNGELYSVNHSSNNINWLSNIISKNNVGNTELFYSSPIVNKNGKIFFSSSVSTYSINSTNGLVVWELPFSTNLRPIVTDQFVFLASKDGFLINIDNQTGKVNWSRNLFKEKSKPKKNKVGEIISILLASDQILATTSKGYFLFIDYKSGKLINYAKASKSGFYSSPIIVNNMIYAIDNKLRLLIFN